MTVIFCGGEDIDFPNGVPVATTNTGGYFRAGYARVAISGTGPASNAKSITFSQLTTGWFTFRTGNWDSSSNVRRAGIVKSGTAGAGLWIGGGSLGNNNLALMSYNGTTQTQLAAEGGSSMAGGLHRIDLNVKAGSVDVYLDGTLLFTWTGNPLTTPGVSGFDQFGIAASYSSEFIAADEDTRLLSLVTLAPNAAGDANAWTGAYTDISETVNNDATSLYTDTVGQDAQFNLNDMPAGSFTIKAVKISARVSKSAVATAGSIGLGVKSGGTINSGAPVAQTTAWATMEAYLPSNPVTTNAWQQSEINALQMNFRSAA